MIQNLLASALLILPLAPVEIPDIQSQVAERIQAAKTKEKIIPASQPEPTTGSSKEPSVAPPAPKPVSATTTPQTDVWWRLAGCESGHKNLRGRTYSGYFQFLGSTWRAMGGTGVAADHSYATQRAAAIRLRNLYGWGQWPSCSRQLGLR